MKMVVPRSGQIADHFLEQRLACDDVEAERRIVEHEHLGRDGQGHRQRDLLLLPFRETAEAAGQRHAERTQPHLDAVLVPFVVEPRTEPRDGGDAHFRRRVRILGDDADALHQRRPARPGVLAEERRAALLRLLLTQQAAHER
jgi:hypothetical protein